MKSRHDTEMWRCASGNPCVKVQSYSINAVLLPDWAATSQVSRGAPRHAAAPRVPLASCPWPELASKSVSWHGLESSRGAWRHSLSMHLGRTQARTKLLGSCRSPFAVECSQVKLVAESFQELRRSWRPRAGGWVGVFGFLNLPGPRFN